MSTATMETISVKDLGSIPRKVAVIIVDLVNNHGVRHRMQAGGGHVYLYNGERQTRPYKISAHRPEETTLIYLDKWIDENVPGYRDRPVDRESLEALAAAVSTSEHVAVEEPEPEPVGGEKWLEDIHGFVTNGEIYRCAHPGCTYQRPGRQGLHLHARTHTTTRSERREQTRGAREKGILAKEQRKIMRQQAVRVLAEQQGMRVVGDDVPDGFRLQAQLDKVEAEYEKYRTKAEADIERLKHELEETKTRLSLIREAMRA